MTHGIDDFANRKSPQTYHFQTNVSVSKELLNQVKEELRQRGASSYNMWLPETRYLPHILHKDEHIMGSVFGKYKDGRGAMIATDQRVLIVNKKPGFFHCDELTFMIVGGITYTRGRLFGFVTLHTRLGDFSFRTFNMKNAANLVDYIETKCLQSMNGDIYENVT